jgi:hypothetical protein
MMEQAAAAERSETTQKLELGDVRFSEERVEALDRGHPVLRIARKEIDHLALRWGLQAARPLVQAAIGVVFLSVGGWVVVNLVGKFLFYGGWVAPKLEGLLATLIPIGGWLLWTSFRRGYYLEVRSRRGRDKIPFARDVSRAEIEALLGQAQQAFSYVVRTDLPDSAPERGRQTPSTT